ncbi:MAG: hypothetical protein ACPG4X_14680 [Pikeienuella sp.]
MSTTRFPNGVTNASRTQSLGMLGMPDPSKFHVFWDDFNHEPFSTEWTITATSVGTGTSALSTPDADGGLARITTAANDNDGLFAETIGELFLIESGKKAWIKTRFQVGDAIQSDMIIGLHSSDTTPLDATMRFAFITQDGSAAMFFNVDDNSTDVDSDTVVTLEDDTFVVLGAYYDGKGNIDLFLNDAKVASMTGVSVPGAEMCVGFGYLNGAAGAETTDIDYLLVVKER